MGSLYLCRQFFGPSVKPQHPIPGNTIQRGNCSFGRIVANMSTHPSPMVGILFRGGGFT